MRKLREKRLTPLVIKEVTRRINLTGVWQAIYTAGIVIPQPVATATYLHRSLNVKKLVETGFSALPMGENMASYVKRNKVPSDFALEKGFFREMQKKDLSDVLKLMKVHFAQFKLHPHYTQEDIGHLLLPRDKVVYTYVVENTEDKEGLKITDLVSFYRLPTQILKPEGLPYDTIEVILAFNQSLGGVQPVQRVNSQQASNSDEIRPTASKG